MRERYYIKIHDRAQYSYIYILTPNLPEPSLPEAVTQQRSTTLCLFLIFTFSLKSSPKAFPTLSLNRNLILNLIS